MYIYFIDPFAFYFIFKTFYFNILLFQKCFRNGTKAILYSLSGSAFSLSFQMTVRVYIYRYLHIHHCYFESLESKLQTGRPLYAKYCSVHVLRTRPFLKHTPSTSQNQEVEHQCNTVMTSAVLGQISPTFSLMPFVGLFFPAPGFNPRTCLIYNFYVPVVSLNLQLFLSLSVFFTTLTF